MSLTDRLHALDSRQQRSPRLAFIAGVVKKFQEDQAGQLAALISYYAFVSLFPLLLVFVTILGFVLQGNPGERQKILDGALGRIPLIGDQLKLHSLSGSGVALAIGIIASLLAGMGITNATQNAFNRIWNVPFKRRPDFLRARLRNLGMLAILGTLIIVSTVAGGFVGSSSHPPLAVVGGVVVAFTFNLALFMIAFKLLTAANIAWRDLLPGVIVASIFWQLLQHLRWLLHRARAQAHPTALRHIRGRPRSARVAVSRCPADDLLGRDQRRTTSPSLAAKLLLSPPARRRQARPDQLRRSRGARRAGERRRGLPRPRVGVDGP